MPLYRDTKIMFFGGSKVIDGEKFSRYGFFRDGWLVKSP